LKGGFFEQQQTLQGLFLYDVTSSYLEGEKNAFGAFGYNRHGKRGKRQIVVGLLCNSLGRPLAIEILPVVVGRLPRAI
jgi:transposase